MKILSFLGGAAALGVGLLAWQGLRPSEPSPTAASPGVADAVPAAPADAGQLTALRAEVSMLDQRVGQLAGELELLRTALQRRPAEAASAPVRSADEVVRAAAAGGTEFNEEQRAAIAEILARAREQEAELRAEERATREEQQLVDRAGRIADQLSLASGDELALVDHLRKEAAKQRDIIERSRAEDYDRELLRDEFVALRDWSQQHLIDTFGQTLADQIREAERGTRGSTLDRGGRGGDGGTGRPGGRGRR